MRYEIKTSVVTFYMENPRREKPAVATLSFEGTSLTTAQLTSLLDSLIRRGQGKRFTSQRNLLSHFLRPLFSYLKGKDVHWPSDSNQWQIFLLRFFQYYLTNMTWSQSVPATRMAHWTALVGGIFDFLVIEEIVPCDVVVPAINKKNIKSQAANQPMLGERRAEATSTQDPPQKLLVNVDFGMSDAEYLDSVEAGCKHRIAQIKEVCQRHWDTLVLDVGTGRSLASAVSEADIKAVEASGRYREVVRGGTPAPLASPGHPKGHIWALAVVRHRLTTGQDQNCISTHTLRALPIFSKKAFKYRNYAALCDYTAMEGWQFDELVAYAQLYRFAGILSAVDAAAACCLLTIEHPEFTSDSLQGVKLLDSRGKYHLLLTDNSESSVLSVDKPRAGQRKSVALTPASQKLVMDIVKLTAPVRKVLRRAGDKAWRYLFLGYGRSGRLGLIEGTTPLLAGDRGVSLARLYPILTSHGLTVGRFDYRRIRNTMGVLKWFETGSIQEMSRRLGNSHRVVVEHYLPPALLHAWNTRIIRRFQNTLIVLAAHEEDYLLDVTDFSTVADLQHFIAQLICEYPADSSPLASEVQARLRNETSVPPIESMPVSGVLNVRLSASSLGYLYAFSDLVSRTLTPEQLRRKDPQSKLTPIQFVDLARLLRHVCENDGIRADLRELLELPRLRGVHAQAIARQADIDARLARLAVEHQWGNQ